MKKLIVLIIFLTFTITTHAAVSAAAVQQCNQVQSKLLIQLNTIGKDFILRRAQEMNRFVKYAEQYAIARCVYTSESAQDQYINMRAVKAYKGALRAMAVPILLNWNNMVKPHTIRPLVNSCISSCSSVMGASLAKQNCESMLLSFDTIINSFPGPETECDLTVSDVPN